MQLASHTTMERLKHLDNLDIYGSINVCSNQWGFASQLIYTLKQSLCSPRRLLLTMDGDGEGLGRVVRCRTVLRNTAVWTLRPGLDAGDEEEQSVLLPSHIHVIQKTPAVEILLIWLQPIPLLHVLLGRKRKKYFTTTDYFTIKKIIQVCYYIYFF